MTPQQRQLVVAGMAGLMAILGLYLGFVAVAGGDDAGEVVLEGGGALALQGDLNAVPSAGEVDPEAQGVTLNTTPGAASVDGQVPDGLDVDGAPVTTAGLVTLPPGDGSAAAVTSAPPAAPVDPAVTTPSDPAVTTAADLATTTAAPSTTAAPAATAAPATTAAPSNPNLDAVEQEIFRLTNALRADPDGPLKRVKPMPSCVNEDFYSINIGSSGHPDATHAYAIDTKISIELARTWSKEMSVGGFRHRDGASASAIYDRLNISWSATGENIAWFDGYAMSDAARIHFEGWRESDTGHYCAMVAPRYSHIGVGHYSEGSQSWATQNFYTPR